MHRRLLRSTALPLLLAAGIGWPSAGFARMSKSLKTELEGYVEQLADEQDPQTRQAVLLTRGWIDARKTDEIIEPFKSHDELRVRLGAGMGLLLAGERKADDFLLAQITESGDVYGTLRTVVTVLPDDEEAKLLAELLESAKPEVQREVFRYLAWQEDGPLFGLLTKQLVGKDDAKRKLAIEALVARREAAALPSAEKMLASKHASARKGGVELILAASKTPANLKEATRLLEKAAEVDDAAVRLPAARRLIELRNPAGTKAILAMLPKVEEAGEQAELMRLVLEEGARPGFEAVEPFLAAEDATVRALAHRLAARSGKPEFAAKLREMYDSTEFEPRLLAIGSVGYTGKKSQALPILTSTLFQGRDDVRRASIEGLAAMGAEEGLDALKRALTSERNPELRLAVIDAIGQVKSKDAVQALRFQVTDPDPKVKMALLTAIRDIGLPEGAKATAVLLRDRDSDVQWQAFLTAMQLDPDAGKAHLSSALRNPPAGFLDDVDRLDTKAKKAVYDYIFEKAKGSVLQQAAVRAMRDDTHGDELRALALKPGLDERFRRDIVIYLADQGGAANVATLERVVRQAADSETKRLAAWMLTRHAKAAMEPTFRGYLGSKDPTLKAIGAYGLATIHGG